ncbi:ribonuclease R family protein [Glacieibacterium frigidum]|uniref:Ribonuclease R n=1 Tax=Glacieibacterium frigidum TaxID=2593303 RepID=A0A552UFS6_9SPHN|nr:VacB/RNase II family 3'-5' exoribonuclease [Glacieibacterium frigidum]TRW17041.1 VacB/RNase II family 3'-5' exoribonuclease [Glacieibacterium frigidum]
MPRRPPPPPPGLPTREAVLRFVADSPTAVGKREIAKAFGLHAQDKIALKALLKEMADAGELEVGPGRTVHRGGGLPRVTVLRIIEAGDGECVAVPDAWDRGTPPPRIRVNEGRSRSALGVNDRVLARIEEQGSGYRAFPMKTLAKSEEFVLGILRKEALGYRLVPVDKKARIDFAVLDRGDAEPGDLVLAEPSGRPPRQHARVVEVLGDPFAPRSFSLIAIHAKGIPHAFNAETIADADRAAALPLGEREDLRHLPILTIDPADARDHDDAVWAAPRDDGGWDAVVAIADVSFYVREGSPLDRSARERGNSVYFPDRVVPMLPEALSADACSLVEGADRAVLACHLTISPEGKLVAHRFSRAVIWCVVNISYEDAQAAIDSSAGAELDVLRHLWGAWGALSKARDARSPLDLDLPERRVRLDEAGRIAAIEVRERLDAHRVIEDFMIAANVAAALALEAKRTACMYRVHEAPGREKLVALKDYLETFGIPFALGQVIQPRTFNKLLNDAKATEYSQQISEQVLRTQTQAYYSPDNKGHFGLALASYGHFTSPIRRYADLVVHRALVRAYKLGDGGLSDAAAGTMARTAEHISMTERRAMEAERDTLDRYVAAHLATKVGETLGTRITGVARFGFFATVDGIGGDGLVPVSTLGDERFVFDEGLKRLEGIETGTAFVPGQRLDLRLVEANPITGALRFELPLGEGATRPRQDRVRTGRRAGQSRVPRGVRRGR